MANGLYTNSELIDTIINDLNTVLKQALTGQYLQACLQIAGISQKLVNLRDTIDNDLKNRNKTIETLKEELRNAGRGVQDMTTNEFVDDLMKKGGGKDGEG